MYHLLAFIETAPTAFLVPMLSTLPAITLVIVRRVTHQKDEPLQQPSIEVWIEIAKPVQHRDHVSTTTKTI